MRSCRVKGVDIGLAASPAAKQKRDHATGIVISYRAKTVPVSRKLPSHFVQKNVMQ